MSTMGVKYPLRICRRRECNLGVKTFGVVTCLIIVLGNLLADAMVDFYVTSAHDQQDTSWAPAAIAVFNGGGVRTSIKTGSY